MAHQAAVEIAREVRNTLAGRPLTAPQAKLYSQRLRLDMGQEGLRSFAPGYVDTYLDEAMLLLQCGLLERGADLESGWRDGIKRAAEILEWLSQSNLKPADAPLHLLAAAAYQVAEYPAMALGHLRRVPDDQPFSVVLREFLRADFPAALKSIHSFWRGQRGLGFADRIDIADITTQVFQHVIMCIGTVCSYLRTGSEAMTERALAKLDKLADGLLHSRDPYSYFLAKLTAASCRRFVEASFWPPVSNLREISSDAAGAALVRFTRSAFSNRRALVWPAQAAGIQRLGENSSFVLCTPTGSGKTTVATLAIVQSLFADPVDNPQRIAALGPGNLVLYLVPSRALAAEIEARLAQDLKGISREPVVVTGLYGGVDWGPTDAWIQTDRPTVVVCTFEKADALLRYLGLVILDRIRLVVVDEIHMVEQDEVRLAGLEDGSSRSFRLEQLGTRLLRARNDREFRVIALSAVAARAAPALARWITASPEAVPATSSYRSTRQMLGRLEVTAAGQYSIRYDLMDGRSLRFDDERPADTPFVPSPFPPLPGGLDATEGPEVRMRAPTLWAALQLAAIRPDGSTPSVLISLTQDIDAFSAKCADLMDVWPEDRLPPYWAVEEADGLWARCLASAADYFTVESVECRLLRRGIAVHHGKMPGLLARRLKIAIDRGYVRVIIATSTLSEGVNIPVNFLLIPSVYRGPNRLSLQEFSNLLGRAGRPGVATEGSALVVLPERLVERRRGRLVRMQPSRQWDGYQRLIAETERTAGAAGEGVPEDRASSPLAHLLLELRSAWAELTGGGSPEDFEAWLEQTAVVEAADIGSAADNYLDSLDAFLIATIHEIEELRRGELRPDEIEDELGAIWRRTYAFAAGRDEAQLARVWLARGRAVKTHYPDPLQRRRIYRSSLPPRSARYLIELIEILRERLRNGVDYARWGAEERFTFVQDILALLSQVPSFRVGTILGRRRNFLEWPIILRWWLAKGTLANQPAPGEITNWYDFVAKNFIYRGTWGIGSILALLLDVEEGQQPIRALEIDDWPRSELPWIAFWMKELITWGTLDPVAAYLLARADAIDRPHAEADARRYYEALPKDLSPNDELDPRRIRDWIGAQSPGLDEAAGAAAFRIEAVLVRQLADYASPRLSVAPIEVDDGLIWIDPAGYIVARTDRPGEWLDEPEAFEFELDIPAARITGNAYS